VGPDELRRQALLEDGHFWYSARRSEVARRLPRATQADAWALDLGAGSGGNTRLLTQHGYRAIALEHHPVAAALARERGLDVLRGDAHQLPFPDGRLDVVLACDVLEHLLHDAQAVAEIRRVLRPGGHLILTVPADPALWSAHDVALHHHRRYTRTSLRDLLSQGELELESLQSWMVLLRPVVSLRRRLALRERTLRPAPSDGPVSDLEPVAAPLNWVLRQVLRVEAALPSLGNRERGVSLIAVATRPGTPSGQA
jgi:SAM-dependent methyltransferase